MVQTPWVFTVTKNVVRFLISVLNFVINLILGITDLLHGRPWAPEKVELITAIVKYNPAQTGIYQSKENRITLKFFADEKVEGKNSNLNQGCFNQDKDVAKVVIANNLALMDELGHKPSPFKVKRIDS